MPMVQRKNDELRRSIYQGESPDNAEVFYSKGVQQIPANKLFHALERIANYDNFETDRHEKGSVPVEGHDDVIFEIEYYDENLQHVSSDPSDFQEPFRVMTVALRSEQPSHKYPLSE